MRAVNAMPARIALALAAAFACLAPFGAAEASPICIVYDDNPTYTDQRSYFQDRLSRIAGQLNAWVATGPFHRPPSASGCRSGSRVFKLVIRSVDLNAQDRVSSFDAQWVAGGSAWEVNILGAGDYSSSKLKSDSDLYQLETQVLLDPALRTAWAPVCRRSRPLSSESRHKFRVELCRQRNMPLA